MSSDIRDGMRTIGSRTTFDSPAAERARVAHECQLFSPSVVFGMRGDTALLTSPGLRSPQRSVKSYLEEAPE